MSRRENGDKTVQSQNVAAPCILRSAVDVGKCDDLACDGGEGYEDGDELDAPPEEEMEEAVVVVRFLSCCEAAVEAICVKACEWARSFESQCREDRAVPASCQQTWTGRNTW